MRRCFSEVLSFSETEITVEVTVRSYYAGDSTMDQILYIEDLGANVQVTITHKKPDASISMPEWHTVNITKPLQFQSNAWTTTHNSGL